MTCLLFPGRRKKWESCWDEVKFCSDKCRFTAKKPKAPDAQAPGTA
jgi:hypothetical protein